MRLWSLLLLPVLLLSACGQPDDPIARGAGAFQGFGCNRCHAVGYEGGNYGPDLTTIGFRKSAEWLHVWLKDPHQWRSATVMPNFNLSDKTREDIIAYLVEQKGQAWKGVRPWDGPEYEDPVKKGERIFLKAGCVACHSLRGAGGYPNNNVIGGQIPPLNKVVEGFSKEELKQRINHGRKSDPADPMQPAPMIFMPAWKEVLKEEDIDAVADYLLSLGGGSKDKGSDW